VPIAAPNTTAHGDSDARTPIVSLAAVTWDFKLVGRTRMLTEAWLRDGQPTHFVQVPSLRTGLERALGWWRPAPAPVVRPWPTLPARWWRRVGQPRLEATQRRRARALRRTLERRGALHEATALVVSPLWTPWLAELPFRHVIYDCIDELSVHVTHPELAGWYAEWEQRLIERCDGAVITAATLGDGLRARRPDLPIRMIRNGVDVERFHQLAAATPRPADVPPADRPVVGFVGALYDWIDWDVIAATAAALPACDFVFVGPHDGRGQPQRVARLPNVRLLGPRPYAAVPAYIATFDVCWVPFRQNAVGLAANPVKIYEYLALGKPVVSTPVADMESFGDHVVAVRDAREAEAALARLAHAPGPAEPRIAFAAANSWTQRAREYVGFIAARPDRTVPRAAHVPRATV
jgi:glycosyltransferase involved in cell wall biosynthesis